MIKDIIEKLGHDGLVIMSLLLTFLSFVFMVLVYNSIPSSDADIKRDLIGYIFNQCNKTINIPINEMQDCVVKLNKEFNIKMDGEKISE